MTPPQEPPPDDVKVEPVPNWPNAVINWIAQVLARHDKERKGKDEAA